MSEYCMEDKIIDILLFSEQYSVNFMACFDADVNFLRDDQKDGKIVTM